MTYLRGICLYSAWAWIAGCALSICLHTPAQASPSSANDYAGETGTASYYGKSHSGKRTSSGAPFDESALTAAHPWLPFGTRVRVSILGTGRSVTVVINDRLPSSRRVIDLSLAAARSLGMVRQGLATVSLAPA